MARKYNGECQKEKRVYGFQFTVYDLKQVNVQTRKL